MTEYATAVIAACYVTAIEYGDFSGLADGEDQLVTDWLDDQPPAACFEYGEPDLDNLRRDDISGLMADCIDVTIWSHSHGS